MAQQGPQVLEKQIVALPLSKGVNEGIRSELLPDDELTACENLVQNHQGCFVKRPGLTILGYTDQDGNGISRPKKLFTSAENNLCVVSTGTSGENCSLYDYDRFGQYPRRKSAICEFSIRSSFVVSSSVKPLKDGQRVFGVASCSNYDAVVYESPRGTNGDLTVALAIYAKGQLVAKYDVPTDAGGFAGAGSAGIKMAFVNDRYFHCHTYAAGIIKSFVHDSWVKWPDYATGFTYVGPAAFAGDPINDIAIDEANGTSLVCWGSHVDVLTNAGVYTEYDLAGTGWSQVSSISVYGSYLGVFGVNTAMNTTAIQDPATPTTNLVAGAPGTWDPNRSDICLGLESGAVAMYICFSDTVNIGSVTSRSVLVGRIPDITVSATPTIVARLYGWEVFSKPTYVPGSQKFYQHVVKSDTSDTVNHTPNKLSPHVVVSLSDVTTTTIGATADTLNTFRPVAVLEPYNAYRVDTPLLTEVAFFSQDSLRYRTIPIAYDAVFVTPNNPSQRSGIAAVHACRANDPDKSWNSCRFGNETIVSGACLQQYDGDRAYECSMVDYPLAQFDATVGAGVDPGLHNYVVVYRHLDAAGNVALSRLFGPFTITVAPASEIIDAEITACQVTARESGRSADYQVQVEVYRTPAGGKEFYLCASSQSEATAATSTVLTITQSMPVLTFSDDLSDASLITNPKLYRQPILGPGSPLDRFPPPGTSVICQHKDRVFVADNYGNRVLYSSFFVDGEAAWFNPQFYIYIHGGTGPITGMSSMDGRLVVFKKDAVFIVDGDGPPENGGNGSEFSQPYRVSSDIGCISQNSIVTTPNGIMFRSQRGIELLSRKLDVLWIGERVQDTVAANPKTIGCTFHRNGSFVKYLLASTYNSDGTYYGLGTEVVYDLSLDIWTTSKYTPSGSPGGYGYSLQGIAQAEVTNDGVTSTCYVDWGDYPYRADESSKVDGLGYYVPATIETSWKKTTGPHERQRVFDAFVIAKKASGNHAITLSLAYNYGTYAQSKTWQPVDFNSAPLEEFVMQPSQMVNTAIRLKVSDAAPSDTVTYPVGAGAGYELLGISWKIAAKSTGPQLASGLKG